jgi:hypothetical protein
MSQLDDEMEFHLNTWNTMFSKYQVGTLLKTVAGGALTFNAGDWGGTAPLSLEEALNRIAANQNKILTALGNDDGISENAADNNDFETMKP